MAGAWMRPSEKKKGKAGVYSCWWRRNDGKRGTCTGTTNYQESKRIAVEKEMLERRIRLGLDDPAERHRKAAGARAIGLHVDDYQAHLAKKGDDEKHVDNTASALRRLFGRAGIEYPGDITPDRVQDALDWLKREGPDGTGRSARTCNHALSAVKSFARWLADAGRIREYPAGLGSIKPYPARSDRRRVRRPLSADELARLLEATEKSTRVVVRRESASRWSPVVAEVDGPARAMCYRVAMATGFRAEEVRTLTPERFRLDGPEPTVTVLASYSKRGKRTGRDDVQPIRRDMAAVFGAWLEGKPPGVPLFPLPADRTGEILADDCRAAGIDPGDGRTAVVDFHSLRHSYVTLLVRSGVNPKIIQKLARHSSITLTFDTYATLDDSEMRAALEGGKDDA